MSASEPLAIPFDGVRLRFGSTKSFDDLTDAVLADVGDEPVPIDDIGRQFKTWESYETRGAIPRRPKRFHVVRAVGTTAGGSSRPESTRRRYGW